MIQSKSDLKFYIEEDMKCNKISRSFWRRIVWRWIIKADNYRVAYFLIVLRYLEYFKNCRQYILGKFFYIILLVIHYRMEARYNIHLSPNVAGYGLRIMHIAGGGGCFLSCEKIGNYCAVNSGVLCGKKDDKIPVLGNGVVLCPGAKVIGGVTIGDNSLIAPNAVVVKDVDANCIVGGVPAKIIKRISVHDNN